MAKYLATFSDVIDETEINGFTIMSDKEIEKLEELASSITWAIYYKFDNGSELEYSDGEDLISRIEFKLLSASDVETIGKLFNDSFGVLLGWIFIKYYNDVDDEEDIEDDDEDDEY
jgi:hypothetical protein